MGASASVSSSSSSYELSLFRPQYDSSLVDKSMAAALQVAHYTPSTFPLKPILTNDRILRCRESWQWIMTQRVRQSTYDIDVHGITIFYNEFYDRLSTIDSQGLYESVLMKYTTGANRIAAKGAILVRIVNTILQLENDSAETREKLAKIGDLHQPMGIRPWQYGVFLEIFVATLAHQLKTSATSEVMEAWVNVMGYALQKILPTAIAGHVIESEAHAVFMDSYQSYKKVNSASTAFSFNNNRGGGGGGGSRSGTVISSNAMDEAGDESVVGALQPPPDEEGGAISSSPQPIRGHSKLGPGGNLPLLADQLSSTTNTSTDGVSGYVYNDAFVTL